MGPQCCGGGTTLETHASLWTTTGQVMVRGGGREWRLVPYVGCRIDWEETESRLLAWLSHSKVGSHPVTDETCTFKTATGKLPHFNTDAVEWLH